MAMTIEQVMDWHRCMVGRCPVVERERHTRMADAISAHLARLEEPTELDALRLEYVEAVEERDHLRRVLAEREKHDQENVEAVVSGAQVNASLNDSYAAAMRRIRELEEQARARLTQPAQAVDVTDEMVDRAFARFYSPSPVDRDDPAWSDMREALTRAIAAEKAG